MIQFRKTEGEWNEIRVCLVSQIRQTDLQKINSSEFGDSHAASVQVIGRRGFDSLVVFRV